MSVGVAWIQTDEGQLLYKSRVEFGSTSQRGEINGLLEALEYATKQACPDEDIIIVTDSEYLYNTVALDWCFKWLDNGWVNADGAPTKNADLWEIICGLLDTLNRQEERVFMQWTAGHLVHYTPGNAKHAMRLDATGIELYSRITTMANRIADKDNIIKKFLHERRVHDKLDVPKEVALEWAIGNAMADHIAGYLVKLIDDTVKSSQEQYKES